jgi:hypothetical protein
MFLRGVIDSRVYHLSKSLENRATRRMPAARRPDTDPDDPPEVPLADPAPEPGELVARVELRERVLALMEEQLAQDPAGLDVLECLDLGITVAAEIAEMTGRPVEDIYNAQRRFKRAAENVRKALGEGSKP